MTKQEIVNQYVNNWASNGAPDPRANHVEFVRWMVAAGHLPADQAERSAARMVRSALGYGDKDVQIEPRDTSPVIPRQTRHQLETTPSGDRRYVFFPRRGSVFSIAEDHIKEMKRAYAQPPYGRGATINQICREWRIGRREFTFVKTELGWTHDQDEFTRDEHLDCTTEQLLADREQRSRQALERARIDAEQAELRRLAALGSSFEARTQALARALRGWEPSAVLARAQRAQVPTDRLLVVPFADLHIGAPGSDQVEQELLAFVSGLPAGCAVLPVWLGDLFHVDTPGRTTTRGTPQETTTNDPYELLTRTYDIGTRLMYHLAQDRTLVNTVVVAGNHDEMSCYHWQHALELMGYPVDLQGGEAMKSFLWGENLLLFEHGDGGAPGRPERLVLAALKRFGAQARHLHLFTGHLHHVKQLDVSGVMCHQLPSPGAPGRWARKKGYLSRRGMQAFEFDAQCGLVCTHWHFFDEEERQ